MRAAAIVPQKPLARAKSRLTSVLAPAPRSGLSLDLLRHVCAVLRAVPAVEALAIMSADSAVRARAGVWGVPVAPDPGPDLNAALAAMIAAAAAGRARRGVLVLAADLPWVGPADVQALLAAGRRGALVLAPSGDGTGTNALLVPPGVSFRPAYGEGSRAAHRERARACGLHLVEVYRPGLAFDLDTPDDLAIVLRRGWSPAS
jgi:2-phospho-L-lactate guanylyltransferase